MNSVRAARKAKRTNGERWLTAAAPMSIYVEMREVKHNAESARERNYYIFSSTYFDDTYVVGPDPTHLADDECVHGNLPSDPGLLCGCWVEQPGPGDAERMYSHPDFGTLAPGLPVAAEECERDVR